ncbi:MAG: SgcJ/EcaC family oxidoreductase [Dehalococcoidia bacterium]
MTHQTQPHGLSPADEAAVRGLYQQMIDGWNAGSGEGFASVFAGDGEQVAFDGTRYQGRAVIAAAHQFLFDTFVKGSRLVGKVLGVRLLTPDVAQMNTIGGTILTGQSDIAPDRNSVQTFIAVKRDGDWRVAAFHNTRAEYLGRPDEAQALTDELRSLLTS